MKLKDILKNIRLENNLTLEELADRLNKYDGVDISKGTISRWENGTREPKNTYISAYAKEFDIDLNVLYGINEYKETKPTSPKEAIRALLSNDVVSANTGINIDDYSDEELEIITDRLLEYARFLNNDKRNNK